MDYIKSNKAAWEEAFDQKTGYYAKDVVATIQSQVDAYIEQPMIDFLNKEKLFDKVIGQFCCNNGRELLSIAKRGIKKGCGFDLATNMVDFGNECAKKLQYPVSFVQSNILEIDKKYYNQFDYVIITVGALCWFKDLMSFFEVVQNTLKKGGKVIINESHPVVNLLATKTENAFIIGHEKELVYDYFKVEPWENESMGYISENKKLSNKFLSFSHSMSSIINAVSANALKIETFDEFDYCIAGLVPHLNHQGIPLSYLMVATKL